MSHFSRVKLLPHFAFLLAAIPGMAQTPLLPNSTVCSQTLRNNYTGFIGMKLSFNSPVQITALGRPYFPPGGAPHTLKLVNAQTGTDVPGGSVQITMDQNGTKPFQYAVLPAPLQLQANTNYLLLSSEVINGDEWCDLANVTPAGGYANFSISGAVYADASGAYVVVPGTPGYSYGPLNLLYSLQSGATNVGITAPYSGQTIPFNSLSNFSATISGAGGVAQGSTLQFLLDGQPYGPLQTAPASGTTFSLTINPQELFEGSHIIGAVYSATGAGPSTATPIPFSIQLGDYYATSPYVESQNFGPLRNNFSGFVGMQIGVSYLGPYQGTVSTTTAPVLLMCLGRYVWPGNSQTHIVKLVNAATGQDVPGASVTVSLNGATPYQYVYTYLPTPMLLYPPNTYNVVSQETAGGDEWADYGVVTTNYYSVFGPVYSTGASYQLVNIAGNSYVPVNLGIREASAFYDSPPAVTLTSPAPGATLSGTVSVAASAVPASDRSFIPNAIRSYQVEIDGQLVGAPSASGTLPLDTTAFTNGPHSLAVVATDTIYFTGTSTPITVYIANGSSGTPPTPFISSFQPTFLRNNYSGFVGMQVTAGASPLHISALGRLCATGNSQTHLIKLVQGTSPTTVSLNMSGCTAGQFVYASIASGNIAVPAGSSFYLVDQETAGADSWYDYSPVTPSAAAAVNGPVYTDSSGAFVLVPFPSHSYVPLNFLYTTGN